MRCPKYWSFSFSIIPSKEHPGLISFRMDWLDLLSVQGTLESSPTPQFKSISSSALSRLHSPTLTSVHDHWKNHSLTRRTFVGKVMSLLFNMLSRLVKAFLPRSKHLLISWLQSPSTVIFSSFSLVAQSCPTLCNPMNRSMRGLPVHHHLPEFTQTHVHQVRDAIQPSHPLSSPSSSAFSPSQHQGL